MIKSTRIISFILALLMVTGIFSSCAGIFGDTETESQSSQVTSSEGSASQSDGASEESDSESGDESENTDSSEESSTAPEEESTHETSDKSEETTVTDVEATETTENTTESADETTETTEDSSEITDVIIGDTLEAEYAADFSVAKIFSDDMVVQRGEHIRVWGFAPASENGKKVSASFKGMFAEAIIENGEWCITFGARLDADTVGAEMKIYAGDNKTVTFTGVLVGDVYLVLGQSNAAYSVTNHLNYNDPTTQGGGKNDIDPNSIIRLNNLNGSGGAYSKAGTDYVYSDLENTTFWTRTTEADTLPFSALGYYFAVQMAKNDPTVPIGLMQVASGGAPIVSFLPNDLAEKWSGDYYNKSTETYIAHANAAHSGRYLYNCYLAPVSNYAIAGILWYQGESNNEINESVKYTATFIDLITRMRDTHNVVNKDFPVFIVEIPSIYRKPANFTGAWNFMELGMIRSYLGSIPSMLKNSYVAVSSDLWADKTFANNLHPNCKFEQAERLAALADVVVNKKGSLETATGPIFKSAEISADKKTVVITFTNVGDGLSTKDSGSTVLGIVGLKANATAHCVIDPVSVTITGKDHITVVFNTEVKAVAYNYDPQNFYGEDINLCNSFGCPAAAFLSPYTEREIGSFKSEDFKSTSYSEVDFNSLAIDVFTADGNNLFTVGKVIPELAAAGNKVSVPEGTVKLLTRGWIGFGHEIIMLGYSIDGNDAIFNSYPSYPSQAVINAGGKYAKRFSISLMIGELEAGKHTVDVLALVDVNGGVAVKFLSFTLIIEAAPEIPEGLDAPAYNAPGYGFKKYSIDLLAKDSTDIYRSGVVNKLAAANYTVTVKKGVKKIRMYGWIAYETTIDKMGYALDGLAVIDTNTLGAEDSVIASGGAYAKRFDVYADISSLAAGHHTVDFLVRINMPDGSTATLKVVSFTLIIEE